MKLNRSLIATLGAMLVVALLNFMVELNAYTTSPERDETFFQIVDYPVSFFTREERCVNESQNVIPCHQLLDLQNGDILITKSSHTLFIRHGHAGMVVDKEAGLVLEALGYQQPSRLESLEKWNYYPTVKVLRLKNVDEEVIEQLVEKAKSEYVDLKYRLFANKSNRHATHCSDIIWKVFQEIGIDLDSNGGYFVMPKDICESPWLEEVYAYGFSKTRAW